MMRFLRLLSDILWPRRTCCMCCDSLSGGTILCMDCNRALQAMRLPPSAMDDDAVCSVYRYDGLAKELVVKLKYDCLADAAHVLAQGMSEAIRDMSLPEDTVLTWVTMPALRKKKRGIDHGRELCMAVGRASGLPVRKLLERKGDVHTQRGLSHSERMSNLEGTIRCRERLDVPVLLIDDVTTTGATVSACAQVLTAAGAPRVYVLTATRAMLKEHNKETRKAGQYGFYTS